jgi:DNA ligase (NAD+)
MTQTDSQSNQTLDSHQQELELLQELGFAVNPLNSVAKSVDQIWQVVQDLESKREGLNYPIDGLVVKLDNNSLKLELGSVGKTPRGWCAVKFAPQEVVTKIIDITWQVGRTGKVTPVAELEPIELQSTIVKRATLHNFAKVQDLINNSKLEKNDLVVIRKAGDIIPEVVKVVKTSNPN